MSLSEYVVVLSNRKESIPVVITTITEDYKFPWESDNDALKRKADEIGGVVVKNDKETFWAPREYRSSWRFNHATMKIELDLNDIKDNMIQNIRKRRNKKLNKLDIPFMRALEEDNTEELKKIKEKKKILRDLPVIVEQRLNDIVNSKKFKPAKKLEQLEAFSVPELLEED